MVNRGRVGANVVHEWWHEPWLKGCSEGFPWYAHDPAIDEILRDLWRGPLLWLGNFKQADLLSDTDRVTFELDIYCRVFKYSGELDQAAFAELGSFPGGLEAD